MPYPCICVEEVDPLLGDVTDKLVLTFVCGRYLLEIVSINSISGLCVKVAAISPAC